MQRLVISVVRSDAAGEFLLDDRSARTLRDGLALPSYLTLPRDDFRDGPLVLAIHGGPYARDIWGYKGLY